MNPHVELNLALILFIPWFSILAGLFWRFPRQPRGPARVTFDGASLLLAVAAAAVAMHWSVANADPQFGPMWQQVLATSIAYGLFLLVMALALCVRRTWLAKAVQASALTPPIETLHP